MHFACWRCLTAVQCAVSLLSSSATGVQFSMAVTVAVDAAPAAVENITALQALGLHCTGAAPLTPHLAPSAYGYDDGITPDVQLVSGGARVAWSFALVRGACVLAVTERRRPHSPASRPTICCSTSRCV